MASGTNLVRYLTTSGILFESDEYVYELTKSRITSNSYEILQSKYQCCKVPLKSTYKAIYSKNIFLTIDLIGAPKSYIDSHDGCILDDDKFVENIKELRKVRHGRTKK